MHFSKHCVSSCIHMLATNIVYVTCLEVTDRDASILLQNYWKNKKAIKAKSKMLA